MAASISTSAGGEERKKTEGDKGEREEAQREVDETET